MVLADDRERCARFFPGRRNLLRQIGRGVDELAVLDVEAPWARPGF
jgi:hypothetical protein